MEHLETADIAVMLAAPPSTDVRRLAQSAVTCIDPEGDGLVEVPPP